MQIDQLLSTLHRQIEDIIAARREQIIREDPKRKKEPQKKEVAPSKGRVSGKSFESIALRFTVILEAIYTLGLVANTGLFSRERTFFSFILASKEQPHVSNALNILTGVPHAKTARGKGRAFFIILIAKQRLFAVHKELMQNISSIKEHYNANSPFYSSQLRELIGQELLPADKLTFFTDEISTKLLFNSDFDSLDKSYDALSNELMRMEEFNFSSKQTANMLNNFCFFATPKNNVSVQVNIVSEKQTKETQTIVLENHSVFSQTENEILASPSISDNSISNQTLIDRSSQTVSETVQVETQTDSFPIEIIESLDEINEQSNVPNSSEKLRALEDEIDRLKKENEAINKKMESLQTESLSQIFDEVIYKKSPSPPRLTVSNSLSNSLSKELSEESGDQKVSPQPQFESEPNPESPNPNEVNEVERSSSETEQRIKRIQIPAKTINRIKKLFISAGLEKEFDSGEWGNLFVEENEEDAPFFSSTPSISSVSPSMDLSQSVIMYDEGENEAFHTLSELLANPLTPLPTQRQNTSVLQNENNEKTLNPTLSQLSQSSLILSDPQNKSFSDLRSNRLAKAESVGTIESFPTIGNGKTHTSLSNLYTGSAMTDSASVPRLNKQ